MTVTTEEAKKVGGGFPRPTARVTPASTAVNYWPRSDDWTSERFTSVLVTLPKQVDDTVDFKFTKSSHPFGVGEITVDSLVGDCKMACPDGAVIVDKGKGLIVLYPAHTNVETLQAARHNLGERASRQVEEINRKWQWSPVTRLTTRRPPKQPKAESASNSEA